MHEPAHCLRHRVISWSVRVGSVLSKPRDRTHDETRVELLQRFVAETIASQRARTKILDHDVDLWDKSFDDVGRLRLLEIEADALFASVVLHKAAALSR